MSDDLLPDIPGAVPNKAWAKVAQMVLEKVSGAIGMVYQPWHARRLADAKAHEIRKTAAAEADAAIVRARSAAIADADVSDMRTRAAMRAELEQLRHQSNIEAITRQALQQVAASAKPENVQSDWIARLYSFARDVSDEELQSVWAKILAGEFNAPGSFSKRTLRMVADFDRVDAELFTSLCRFSVGYIEGPYPLIYDHNHPIYSSHFKYTHLSHLESIGLITMADGPGGFALQRQPQVMQLEYFDSVLVVTMPTIATPPGVEPQYSFELGRVLFTRSGLELFKIANPIPVVGFLEYLSNHLAFQRIQCSIRSIVPGESGAVVASQQGPAQE